MALELSRRTTLTSGLAALAAGRALADPTPSVVPALADSTGRLTVETTIAGKGPFHFLIDTGADRSVVADDVAAQFGPPDPEPITVEGIAATISTPAVKLHEVAFGPVVLDRLRAPVLPRARLGADGYLGLDAINGQRVEFDFVRHALTVEVGHARLGGEYNDYGAARVPVDGRHGKLISTDCSVDGATTNAFVDSGAEITIGNMRLLERLQAASEKRYASRGDITITGVTGGSAVGQLVDIDTVQLGELTFTGCSLAICDLPIFDLWGIADRPSLLIGMNFLSRSQSISIDYRRRELLFRIADVRVASRA